MDEKKFVADLEDYIERSVEVAKEFKKLSPKLKVTAAP